MEPITHLISLKQSLPKKSSETTKTPLNSGVCIEFKHVFIEYMAANARTER